MTFSSEILNLSLIEKASVIQQPYSFFGVENAFKSDAISSLLNDFPSISEGGSFSLDDILLKGSIKTLVEELEGDQFRSLMGKKFDVDFVVILDKKMDAYILTPKLN